MNTRKLHTGFPSNPHDKPLGEIIIFAADGTQVAGCHNPNSQRDNVADAAELVKRWNMHGELVAALEQMDLTFGDTAFAESEAGQDALTQTRALLATLKA